EGDMRRTIQKGYDLHKITQSVVRQFLKFSWRQSVRLDNCRGTLVLKMSLKFNGKSIDLKKCGLPHCPFQHIEMVQMMGIVPVDFTELQIRPVNNFPFRQLQISVARFDELQQCLHPIEESGGRIARDADIVSL